MLTYDGALDEGLDAGHDRVTRLVVDGSTVAVSTVTVSGRTVTLTLATAVTHGQVVTVSYTVPDTNPVPGRRRATPRRR